MLVQVAQGLLSEGLQPPLVSSSHHVAPVVCPGRQPRYVADSVGHVSFVIIALTHLPTLPAAGGRLRAPESLYETVTKSTINNVENAFPASKGYVQASDSKLQAELDVYRNETTAIINALVGKVNSLTPVGC